MPMLYILFPIETILSAFQDIVLSFLLNVSVCVCVCLFAWLFDTVKEKKRDFNSFFRTVIFHRLSALHPPLLLTGRIFDYAKQIGKSYLCNSIWDYLFCCVHSRSKLWEDTILRVAVQERRWTWGHLCRKRSHNQARAKLSCDVQKFLKFSHWSRCSWQADVGWPLCLVSLGVREMNSIRRKSDLNSPFQGVPASLYIQLKQQQNESTEQLMFNRGV